MPSFSKALLALLLATTAAALPTPQLAGEGAALNSIFSDIDNGVGYGIENAEENLAANIAGLKGTSTGTTTGGAAAPPPPPGPGPRSRRQLDKISNGFQAIGNSLGVGSSTSGTTTMLDNVDGTLTSGAADLGASVGGTFESTMESIGKSVPRI
jgi:hypothetical protein